MSPWYVFDTSSVDLVGLDTVVVKKTEGTSAYFNILLTVHLNIFIPQYQPT